MSYTSRVYRQRNAHTPDEKADESPFFSKSEKQSDRAKNNKAFFQPKLEVGPSNDKYEKEADAVAGAVVNNKNKPGSAVQQKKISSIQKLATPEDEKKMSTNEERMKEDKDVQQKHDLQAKCDECEKEDKQKSVQKMDDPEKKKEDKEGAVQKMDEPEKKKEDKEGAVQKMDEPEKKKEDKEGAVQKKSDGAGHAASPQLSSRIEQSAGKGKALPTKTLESMESSLAHDFSDVNIHTGADSVEMTKDLGAQAFTHGNDIYFNSGKFNPDTSNGQELLAHELTHVVQQGKGKKNKAAKKKNK